MDQLPKWRFPRTQPAFQDWESVTVLEAIHKLYGLMNELVEEFNKADVEIQDAVKYMKTNLEASILELIRELNEKGELDEYILDAFNNLNKQLEEAVKTINASIETTNQNIANHEEKSKNYSNPNLLINSDFRNPINQRGNTSYTSASGVWTRFFSIDRWYIKYGCSLTVNDGSITVKNTTSNTAYFGYAFENILPEGNYTFTIKVKSLSGNAVAPDGETRLVTGENKVHKYISGDNSISLAVLSGCIIELEYIKLEQGSLATPFTPRPYAEELMMCQRFYQKSVAYEYFGNIMTMGSNAYRILSNYQEFRTAPTVKVESGTELLIYNRTDGVHVAENPIISEIIATANGMLKITAPYTDGTVLNPGIVGIIQISKPLEFDAEIY